MNDKVRILNRWIRSFASERGIPVIDYYQDSVDVVGVGRPSFYQDGLHPNTVAQKAYVAIAAKTLRDSAIIP